MTSTQFLRPGESLQRKQTVYRVYTDQHGRKFSAQADVGNQHPKEELRPVNDDPRNQFTPPWLPPMRFAKFTDDGSLNFRWDYSTMATELAGQTAEIYSDYRKVAVKEKLPIPEVGGVVDSMLRDIIGEPPLSPAIPLACEQGDPWILGKPNAPVNPYLKEILEQGVGSSSKEALAYINKRLTETARELAIPMVPTAPVVQPKSERQKSITDVNPGTAPTYQEFMKECRGRGMKQPEIIALWNEHKALMAN